MGRARAASGVRSVDSVQASRRRIKVFIDGACEPNVHKKWRRIVKAAEIPAITLHDLRRTGITRALLANMPPVVVQKLAGHRDIKTTLRYYTEVSKADLRQAVKRMRNASG